MRKKPLKEPEWWLTLVASAIALNGVEAVKQLSKLLGNDAPEVKKQILEHYNRNIKEIDIPLKINEQISLRNIYVSPPAKWRRITSGEKREFKEIESLIPELDRLLNEENYSPLILHGQPGHGKTSAVKILAGALTAKAQKEKKQAPLILFYEFNKLHNLQRNEFTILKEVTKFTENEEFFHNRDTIMILDGMDERQVSNDDRGIKDFLRNIFELSRRTNHRENSSLKLILTGRSKYIEQISEVLPEAYHEIEICNFTDREIQLWLEKFNSASGNSLTIRELNERHLDDLKYQPVILTLCATMLCSKEGKELFSKEGDTQLSREAVYEKIIQWTYKKRQAQRWNYEEYLAFLQALAFVLFSSGKTDMQTDELCEKLPEYKDLLGLNKAIIDKPEEELKNLAICFFFKSEKKNSFAFIHKSIEDYLVAKAIVDGLVSATEGFSEKKLESSCQRMASDIYRLLGKNSISEPDHMNFISEILENNTDKLGRLFAPLCAFFPQTLNHRFLLKEASIKEGEDPLRTEAFMQANLLKLIGLSALTGGDCYKEKIKNFYLLWAGRESIQHLYHFFNAYNLRVYFLFLYACGLDLSDCYLARVILRNVNFQNANLQSADLRDANLQNANFQNANLQSADLRDANLQNANLRDASLWSADLRDANLQNANLRDAYLRSANLRDASLWSADLRNANLRDAYLSDADFQSADLRDADLRSASFWSAYLRDADLRYADLRSANLRDADLRNANLRNALLFDVDLSKCRSIEGAIFDHALYIEISNKDRNNIEEIIRGSAKDDSKKYIDFFWDYSSTIFPEYFSHKDKMINAWDYFLEHKNLPWRTSL